MIKKILPCSSHSGTKGIDEEIVKQIKDCLDECNSLVKKYRMASEILKRNKHVDVKLCLLRHNDSKARPFDMPTASEVAALIVGDFDRSHYKRDIIVEKQGGSLKRVDELHSAYLPLQYPIIFHYGDNGYAPTTLHSEATLEKTEKKTRLTIREYLAFRLMDRTFE